MGTERHPALTNVLFVIVVLGVNRDTVGNEVS